MTWVRTLFGEVCSWSVHWDGCTVSDQSTIWRRSLIWAETDKIKRHYYKNAAKDPNEGFFTWTFQSSSPLGDEQITCQPFCHTNPLLHHMHEPVLCAYYFTPAAISIFSILCAADPLSLLCMSKPVQPRLLLWCTRSLLCPSQSPSTKSSRVFILGSCFSWDFVWTENRFWIWDFFW